MRLHHYGLATKSVDRSLKEFEKLGYTRVSNNIVDPVQGVELLFIDNNAGHLIELVSPVSDRSPVNRILEKVGLSIYHICYEVEDLDNVIAEFKSKRFIKVMKPTPATAFGNKRICFLYNALTGLIELLER
ncbi:MAG: lactoylglutathione lyase [Bergeyella sp.]|nr:lactoylglutathione lyase [Bergeyella sp.]